ncbi:hypothetical protein JCM11251_003733 [Rhodosporidiobolus azoricus]
MAAVRHYGGRSEPLQALKQARGYDSVPPKSRKQQSYEGDSDGLAITYDLHDQQPVYHADVHPDSMSWNSNQVPTARNKQNGNFRSAYDAENDKSNRVDSVFDAYVDMYADDSDSRDEDLGEDATEDLSVTMPQTAPLRTGNARSRQDDLQPYEEEPQEQQPWDERGKTGLYGGGGRGADDRETGWVRGYAFSPPQQAPGFEEDLQFDGDEEVGPKDRKGSRDSRGSRATQGRRTDDGRRRSSSETTPSSYGPVTPVSATFNPQSIAPKHAYADSGYRSASSPPSSEPSMRHTHNHSNDSSFATSQHRSSTPPPPVPAPVRPTRVSPPTQPVHTIDPAIVKKKATSSAIPVPSAPMPVGAPHPMPSINGKPALLGERPRRKSAFAKFGRGKKAPTISAPILPDGFVDSLGMETFALYPGCKPPAHAILSPVMRDSADAPQRAISPPARTISPPVARSGTPPSARKAAPRPLNGNVRPLNAPQMKLGAPVFDRAASPALATPVRLPLGALRDDTDAASEGYPEDAFRRLSKTSDGSYVPVNGEQSSMVQSRKYFDSIRQEHARHEEVQANRVVVPTNAPGIPNGSSTVNGFRDPWSAGGAGQSSRSSVHSQRTTAAPNRNSYYHGGGGDRASMASTAHEHDYRRESNPNPRKASYVSGRSRLSQQYDVGRGAASPSPKLAVPSAAGSSTSSPFQPTLSDRNGSVSSAYSEVSEMPPSNDFHPRNNPGFEPRNAVGHLRKNSLAGMSSLPLPPSGSSGAPSSAYAIPQETYGPTAPLNLSRRPSHLYGQSNKFGGDVVWGGGNGSGIGGPKDLASPIPEAMSPASSYGEQLPTIGTTGFRNPFGAR